MMNSSPLLQGVPNKHLNQDTFNLGFALMPYDSISSPSSSLALVIARSNRLAAADLIRLEPLENGTCTQPRRVSNVTSDAACA